jgi:hypothetical protein
VVTTSFELNTPILSFQRTQSTSLSLRNRRKVNVTGLDRVRNSSTDFEKMKEIPIMGAKVC